jgi:hypothetical protein
VCAGLSVPVKQTQISWPTVRELTAQAPRSSQVLRATAAPIHHYRDGDVVVYRRPGSAVWQCRCKLTGGRWLRLSTRLRNLQDAARRACERYDEMRFRERLGLAPQRRRFRDIAEATLEQLRAELASGSAKSIYRDYCAAIERYFLPFFGNRFVDQITHPACQGHGWPEAIAQRLPHRVFRYTSGAQPHNFNAVFRRLLTDAGLLKDSMARTRTLYLNRAGFVGGSIS